MNDHFSDRHERAGPGDPDRRNESPMPNLGATLREALAPDQDVRRTAKHKVDRALHARSAAAGYTSLLGVSVATLRHLLTNPPRPADRYAMADDIGIDSSTEAVIDDE